MSAITRHLLQTVALVLAIGSISVAAQAGEPSAGTGRISKRMSDAILAEFRNAEISRPSIAEATPVEADPEVVVLPELLVRERFDVGSLNSGNLTPPTEAIPLKLGTGITEYRGKRVSVLTQRVLFIPLGFKLAW